ncbi:MAG: IS4 family transposase [Syntrophobacteraceae bacterium]
MRVFPLESLNWLYGSLVSRLQKSCEQERARWHGLRLRAADKTTLALPESRSLWECFGAHKGSQGLGPVAVELCCLFDPITRAPLRFVYAKVCTSEHKLIKKLIKHIRKNDLLLLDSGFYHCDTFAKITLRHAHFIIPAMTTYRPRVLSKLAEGDYLCEIKDSSTKTTLTVRVVFVNRDGFRRRRLVTSLLDHIAFPATDLARLYRMRWDIETFYRDFKQTLRGTSWHCRTPMRFHQEILVHMIAICMIRLAMVEAGHQKNACVAQLSFTRALTETRLFLKLLVAATDPDLWPSIWEAFVQCCARHRVNSKPGRQFPRDRQEYRRKNRGLEKRRRGRKPKFKTASPLRPQPETRKDLKGQLFLLS